MTDHAAHIDLSVLASIVDPQQGGDPEFFAHLVSIFRTQTPPAIAAMRSAIAEGDSTELMTGAHTLKGRSGIWGAMALWSMCERLEAVGRSGDIGGASGLLDEIEGEAAELLVILEQEERRWTT